MAGGYNMTGGGGGLNPLDWISGLSGGLGGFLSYLGGGEERAFDKWKREYTKSLVPKLQGELNTPAISQGQVMGMVPQLQKGLSPYLNQLAGNASARLGLDSGAAQGEIARGGYGQLQGMLAELMQKAMMMNAQKRQNVLGMLSGLGG
jgi:hypothetical protein